MTDEEIQACRNELRQLTEQNTCADALGVMIKHGIPVWDAIWIISSVISELLGEGLAPQT